MIEGEVRGDTGTIGRTHGGVDDLEEFGHRHRRGERHVGADVAAGAEQQQTIGGGEERVEELGPMFAAGVAVADAGLRRQEVVGGGDGGRTEVVVEPEQTDHPMRDAALRGEC